MKLWDVATPTRDGVRLSADIHLPEGGSPGPAILVRTPYGKNGPVVAEAAKVFVARGWAVVVQDVRGRNDSLGAWVPFVHEAADGFDAVEWVATQPWCDGRVATWGGSYLGYTQWALAGEVPPHLTAMMSTASAARLGEELPYDRGIPSLAMAAWLHLVGGRTMQNPRAVDWPAVFQHLPVRELDTAMGHDLPIWREWLDHPELDYWLPLRPDRHFADVDLPVLHVTGWFDDDQPGAMHCWDGMARKARQNLVIGPWDHGGTRVPRQEFGGVDFGPASVVDVLELQARWLATVLAGGDDPARIRLFLTGSDRWVETDEFGHDAHSSLELFLTGDGRLTGTPGEGETSFVYDPADPVPSGLDDDVYAPSVDLPFDRSFQLDRADVVAWTGDPVTEELQLVGWPVLHLDAVTDCPDTDWFAAIYDVAPDGSSVWLAAGRLRARFAGGLDRERPVEPGAVVTYRIELSAIGHVLRPGHRPRVSVTSSDFPVFDRNPNTGGRIGYDTTWRVATNTVVHTSRLWLPIADASSLREIADLPLRSASGADQPAVNV